MKKIIFLLFSILSFFPAFPEFNYNNDKSEIPIPCSEANSAKKAVPTAKENSSTKFKYEGIWYEIIDPEERTCKTITVQESFGYGDQGNDVFGDLVLPETVYYEGEPYTLTVIGKLSFTDCGGLLSVTIPNSVVEIEERAFNDCGALSKVTLSESLTTIGENAFAFCQRLRWLYIPESVVTIKAEAFYHSGLRSLCLPESITKIDARVYSTCYDLGDIVIPSNVTILQTQAFSSAGITSVVIPASVNFFGYAVFSYCRNLKYVINYAETPQDIKMSTYNYEIFYSTPISDCTLYVPEKSIPAYKEAYGWKDFGEIKSIESGEWEQKEEENSSDFEYDGILYTIVDPVKKTCKTKAGSEAGAGNPEVSATVVLPPVVFNGESEYTLVEIGEYSFYNCKNLNEIEIPSTVTSISSNAFENSGIITALLPESLTVIYDFAFRGCRELSSISFPSSLDYIGAYAFYECSSLPSLYHEGEELYIGGFAFYGCTGLQSVNLSRLENATITTYAFAECSNLESLYLPPSEFEGMLEPHAFKNCISLKEIVVPSIYPPGLMDENTFFNVDKTTCVLYVPKESIEYYRMALGWNAFENIEPIEDTGSGEELGPDPEQPEPDQEERECEIKYVGMNDTLLGSETLTFTLPVPEKIEGYVFVKWVIVGGDLDDGIRIQAVYEEDLELGVESEMELTPDMKAQKIIKNGKIYILKGDKIIDLTGIKN